jgi:hypothetical protein
MVDYPKWLRGIVRRRRRARLPCGIGSLDDELFSYLPDVEGGERDLGAADRGFLPPRSDEYPQVVTKEYADLCRAYRVTRVMAVSRSMRAGTERGRIPPCGKG